MLYFTYRSFPFCSALPSARQEGKGDRGRCRLDELLGVERKGRKEEGGGSGEMGPRREWGDGAQAGKGWWVGDDSTVRREGRGREGAGRDIWEGRKGQIG